VADENYPLDHCRWTLWEIAHIRAEALRLAAMLLPISEESELRADEIVARREKNRESRPL